MRFQENTWSTWRHGRLNIKPSAIRSINYNSYNRPHLVREDFVVVVVQWSLLKIP